MLDSAAPDRPWHAATAEETFRALEARPGGLSAAEAAARLARYGPNRLPEGKRRGPLRRFLAQFENLLIYVLLASAAVTAALGHAVDAAVILGVVVINAIVGFVQEGRAENALAAIRDMLAPRASALRDGRRVSVPGETLAPGDVVLIEAGDRVPADLRLFEARRLTMQEAMLTGESLPVEKAVEPVAPDAPLGDRRSMAFSGAFVAAGQGRGVVVATGAAAEIGRISGMVAELETLETPLVRQMARFARWLTGAILGLSALIFGFGLAMGRATVDELFLSVVGLAVAAIPEGLPAIMTIALALGVQRMARRNAIVRRLPAIEALGSVSVICSDKTGTLTRNEMTVASVATERSLVVVSGAGYAPEGGFAVDGVPRAPAEVPHLTELARAALLCSDAHLSRGPKGWTIDGDPMEGALVTLAVKAGLDPEAERAAAPRRDVIPFDAVHRFMAALCDGRDGPFIVVKGAPERLLEMCAAQRDTVGDEPIDAAYWRARAHEIADRGERVLAVAARPAPHGLGDFDFAHVETGLTLLGLVGFIDPPRPEAVAAVAECRAAGVDVKMITGDHVGTAEAIARQLGLGDGAPALTGAEIDALDDAALRARVRATRVFARTSPAHKLRLVEALQAEGAVVAMTGDGVNDAPALKRADIGVAMGVAGSEAAKEAAQMVLADDNFATIAAAVKAGRTVYDNLTKSILFVLPTNGGQAFVMIVAILSGLSAPITAVQILWINMVTAVTLGIALAFEPPEPGVMTRPPRPADAPLLSRFLVWRTALVSALFAAGVFGLYEHALATGAPVDQARAVAVNALVAMEIVYLFSVRFLHSRALTWRGALGTPAVWIAVVSVIGLQAAFTFVPFMQRLFGTAAITPLQAALCAGCALVVFALVELEKLAVRGLVRR